MPKKIKPKFKAYSIVHDAVEHGLQYALNRLEDGGVEITDDQRAACIDPMMNELMIALCEIINFDD